MSAPHQVPLSDAAPSAAGAPEEKGGKGKLIGIILGGVLGIAVIILALLFFLPKEELPLEPAKPAKPAKPDTTLADYLKGKRLTYVLTEDVLKAGPFAAMMGPSLTAQLSGKMVFQQFDKDGNTTQFGLAIPNMSAAGSPEPGSERMAVVEKGTYSVDGLNLMITKDGGNDTVVFTKAEPVAGDEIIMKYPNGEKVKISIVKVEPAEPLEDFNMAMMGSLGLKLPAGLAGLMPTAGLPGASKGKGKGKPQAGYPARKMQWTYGAGGRDLVGWKGRTMQQVYQSFGNPDSRQETSTGGEWQYNNMNITDAERKPHHTVTFVYMVNGIVGDIL
ncbi:MAG: hypothetical protein VB855_11605, partial [Pirellulaceae bacterium]